MTKTDHSTPRHIGIIAGGGNLPVHVAQAVRETDDDLSVIAIVPDSEPGRFVGAKAFPLSKFGKMIKALEKSGVTHVCMAGTVSRPDFSSFKPDLAAMRYLPGTLRAAKQGDDALLRHVMGIFEQRGFQIVSAQSLCEPLLMKEGPLGAVSIHHAHRDDALQAMQVVERLGSLDIGQGAVVADGVVLAVEAQEGTDAMLRRVAELPSALRGSSSTRVGVLAKRPKPGQDLRVDLPTIGPATVELAAAAGLAGIIGEAGQAFVIDAETVRELADRNNLFVVGLPAAKSPSRTQHAP
jgi:DUF1009 family protein